MTTTTVNDSASCRAWSRLIWAILALLTLGACAQEPARITVAGSGIHALLAPEGGQGTAPRGLSPTRSSSAAVAAMDALVTAPLAGERVVAGTCAALRVEGRDRRRACSGRMRVMVDPSTGELTVTVLLQDGSRYELSGPQIHAPHRNVRAHRIDRVLRSPGPDRPPVPIARFPGACAYINQIGGQIHLRCDVANSAGPSFLVFGFIGGA